MRAETEPSISVVIAVYQAEEWIAEAIDSILGQTRPPDEVVVVNDGSTDGTGRILTAYGDRIRVIEQENAGYPAAMNRAIQEATSEFVAPCGADDIWEPRKLEWQAEALVAHPEVGVFFGHAIMFGQSERDFERPTGSGGLLDQRALLEDLFFRNPINMPSTVIRRDLFGDLGWFLDRFLADDLEFFFRCLRADTSFYYEPRTLVRYRLHERNITGNYIAMHEATHLVHRWNIDLIAGRRFAARVFAKDLFTIGRAYVDAGQSDKGREWIRKSLRYADYSTASATTRALAWIVILSLPTGTRERTGRALVDLRRSIHRLRRGRHPALP